MNSEYKRPDWIVAERKIPLKPSTDQLKDLPLDQVIWLEAGEKYFVESYEQAAAGHWRVKLEGERFEDIDHSYVYDHPVNSHVLLSWEEDYGEQEDVKAPDVISTQEKCLDVGDRLTPDMPFVTRITPNITYGEFALYQEARRFDERYQCRTAYEIAVFLEQVRAEFGGNPIQITSGYRPKAINRRIGGATRSEHLFSEPMIGAVDFRVKYVPILEVQKYCDSEWSASVGYGADRGFVHLGIRRNKRRPIRWNY